MTETIKYTCSCCGKEHEDWPALVYVSPTNYDTLSKADKKILRSFAQTFASLPTPTTRINLFVCTLTQKVIDYCQDLEYGLWVSLSDKSFQDYSDNFKNENYEAKYFGWLSNDLPGYDFTEDSIPTTVFTRTGGNRPEIVPHKGFDHPFVNDYYNGITKTEAERRIQAMLRIINQRDSDTTQTKPG